MKSSPQFAPARRKPPFDEGFTNAVFRVTSLTNWGGAQVPWSAELDTFRPAPGDQPRLVRYTRYEIMLTKWSKNPKEVEFKPRLPGLTTISDARVFHLVGSHTYLAREDWPSLEEVTRAAGFAQKAEVVKAARAAEQVGKQPR